MAFIYLASPYTHKDHDVMEERYQQVMRYSAQMLRDGKHNYSPIVHCHEMAKAHDLPREFDFWVDYNKSMLEQAKDLYVLALEGWQESVGIKAEIELAKAMLIPTQVIVPVFHK